MGKNNDYTTGNFLDCECFSKHYRLTAIDLSNRVELETTCLSQQINFIGILDRNDGATIVFIIEKSEEKTFKFSQNAIVRFSLMIVNLLNGSDIESSKFATKKWLVTHHINSKKYGSCTFEMGDIMVTDVDENTDVAFKIVLHLRNV